MPRPYGRADAYFHRLVLGHQLCSPVHPGESCRARKQALRLVAGPEYRRPGRQKLPRDGPRGSSDSVPEHTGVRLGRTFRPDNVRSTENDSISDDGSQTGVTTKNDDADVSGLLRISEPRIPCRISPLLGDL